MISERLVNVEWHEKRCSKCLVHFFFMQSVLFFPRLSFLVAYLGDIPTVNRASLTL